MAAEDGTTFGDLLRSRRRSVHLTQEALAEQAGVSARTIADLERGVIRAPRRDTLEMLADALNLPPDERHQWQKLRRERSGRTPTSRVSTSLPQPPNLLIGREREVNALINLLSEPSTRLVTITGPGGVGKTRTALAVGHELAGAFQNGVHLVELASVRDPGLLMPAIAQHFGFRQSNPEMIRERVRTFLAQRDLLLILDNVEHLRSAATELSGLLANTTSLKMLVTSRAGLHIGAEHEFPISPLRLPEWDNVSDIARLQTYPGIQLFIQRSQQARPDFVLTPDNGHAISLICAYLDGIPLAIELAAARVKVLSPEQMLSRLVDRLAFLTGGLLDAPDRHKTMRTAIGWSYDLLEPADQRLFRLLSAFVGGWSLEAAEAVAAPELDAIDGLARLTNDNLVSRLEQPDGSWRFRMLETVREFGIEQLEATGESDEASQRHADYFLQLAERAEPELRGAQQAVWLGRLAAETANFRAALAWSQRSDVDPDLGLRLAGALSWFWEGQGHVSEGREWLTRALERETNDQSIRMRALSGCGWMAHIQHDSSSAYRLLNESLDLALKTGDRWTESWVLHLIGRIAYFDGDGHRAREYGEKSQSVARELNDRWLIAWGDHLLGLAAFIDDDFERARRHYEASLSAREELGYPEGIGLINGLIGILTLREGDHTAAVHYLSRGLEIGHRIGARWLVINWIANMILIAARQGDPERAARLAGFVDAMSATTGAIPIPISDETFQEGIESARAQLADGDFRELFAAGRLMALDDAVEQALALGR